MKISDLNKRVSFIRKIKTQTPSGSIKEVEQEVYSCWASRKEQYMSDIKTTIGTTLENAVSFLIRSPKGFEIKTSDLIKYNNVNYQVIKVSQDTIYTIIMAKVVG